MKYLAGSGPQKIQDYTPAVKNHIIDTTIEAIQPWLQQDDVTLLTGFAEGYDTCIMVVAQQLGIPYIGCIPTRGYGRDRWGRNSRTGTNRYKQYLKYVEQAQEIEYTDSYYNIQGTKKDGISITLWRNQRLIDRCDGLLAWTSRRKLTGHTKDCVQRAIKAEKYVEYLLQLNKNHLRAHGPTYLELRCPKDR